MTGSAVIELVEHRLGLPSGSVLSAGRRKSVAQARQIVYWLLRESSLPEMSWSEIGDAVGRDHSTVLHGCREVRVRRGLDRRIRQLTDDLLREAQK